MAVKKNIYVLFIGTGSSIRVEDFTTGNINFQYEFLNNGPFEDRNIFISCYKILNTLLKKRFNGLIVNGWELPEFWIAVFFTKVRRGLALESTDFESSTLGFKKLLKRLFLSRINFALPAGMPHKRLLYSLGFKGDIRITGGVGLTSQLKLQNNINCIRIYKGLYIGRLSQEKNLKFLIEAVNEMENIELTIVGSGEQRFELEQLAESNIHFSGHIANKDLNEVFAEHHFLILPSASEPWGLVIEEALQAGRPVIVSDAVGCFEDLVKNRQVGEIFKTGSHDGLKKAIIKMTALENYKRFVENIKLINWQIIREKQINTYLGLGYINDMESY